MARSIVDSPLVVVVVVAGAAAAAAAGPPTVAQETTSVRSFVRSIAGRPSVRSRARPSTVCSLLLLLLLQERPSVRSPVRSIAGRSPRMNAIPTIGYVRYSTSSVK